MADNPDESSKAGRRNSPNPSESTIAEQLRVPLPGKENSHRVQLTVDGDATITREPGYYRKDEWLNVKVGVSSLLPDPNLRVIDQYIAVRGNRFPDGATLVGLQGRLDIYQGRLFQAKGLIRPTYINGNVRVPAGSLDDPVAIYRFPRLPDTDYSVRFIYYGAWIRNNQTGSASYVNLGRNTSTIIYPKELDVLSHRPGAGKTVAASSPEGQSGRAGNFERFLNGSTELPNTAAGDLVRRLGQQKSNFEGRGLKR